MGWRGRDASEGLTHTLTHSPPHSLTPTHVLTGTYLSIATSSIGDMQLAMPALLTTATRGKGTLLPRAGARAARSCCTWV